MLISLKRIIRTGWKSFFRNLSLNTATVFVMTMVVFLVTMIFIFNFASDIMISGIQDKVDVSVYLKEETSVEEALDFKSVLSQVPEVKEVEYISKEEALESFIDNHRDDPLLMESLAEVGQNPFLDSLSVKAWQASQYSQVVEFLERDSFKGLIEKVDYYKRKPVIEKIFSVTSGINRGAVLFGIVLGVVAFLVAFNTIRIAINNYSEEVSVMRLVGASDWFIRGPFLVQGLLAGILSVLVALFLSFIVVFGLDPKIKILAPEISVLNLFLTNFFVILLIQFATGLGLGMVSSFLAMRKYLKI